MKKIKKLILAFAVMAAGLQPVFSQWTEEEIEAMLTREVEVENPVYMPVLGVGMGYFNFYGNVNNAFRSPMMGKPGVRVNLAGFMDRNRYFRWNIYFLTGELSGRQRFVPEAADSSILRNMNFKSNIYSFGISALYSFKPLLTGKNFEPFISIGLGTLQFDSKGDYSSDKGRYYWWSDGTIRDGAEDRKPDAKIIMPDYVYETDIRTVYETGLGKYSQNTFSIPIDIGIDFNVSNRVTLRAATSLHYTFTDLIDGKSSKSENSDFKGKGGNNMFTFSYLSLNVDLFSPPRTKTIEDLMASIDDFDWTLYDDQDDDGVFDLYDLCPDTPQGIPVDTVGCPFDRDGDGVPDYLDREPDSRPGAIVDEYGVEINENMVIEVLNAMAIRRSDVESYLLMHRMQYRGRREEPLPIPDKFKRVDTNGDGYISFDELLKSINDVFDNIVNFSPDDVKELIDFFFEQ